MHSNSNFWLSWRCNSIINDSNRTNGDILKCAGSMTSRRHRHKNPRNNHIQLQEGREKIKAEGNFCFVLHH